MLLRITAVAGLLALSAACQSRETPPADTPPRQEKGTGGATAVISYDSLRYKVFSNAQATELTAPELKRVEHLLAASVDEYNQKIQQNPRQPAAKPIVLQKYNRQVVAVLNAQGEKEVWVNCLCDAPANWRRRVIMVSGGGSCYFSVKLNLSRGTWYEFSVNGQV